MVVEVAVLLKPFKMQYTFPLVTVLSALSGSGLFNFKGHLGNVAPHFKPNFGLAGGLGTGMPNECSIEQVQLVRLSFSSDLRLEYAQMITA